MMGEDMAELTTDEVLLFGPNLGLFRILGLFLTALAQRRPASAEGRYRSSPCFLMPPGLRARRRDMMFSIQANSSSPSSFPSQ